MINIKSTIGWIYIFFFNNKILYDIIVNESRDNMSILKIENISKSYGSGENQVNSLDNVSLEIQNGEFIAITGSSGSGKSTLLHIIGSVDKPTSGRVLLE